MSINKHTSNFDKKKVYIFNKSGVYIVILGLKEIGLQLKSSCKIS
jgi:hypothetical protein